MSWVTVSRERFVELQPLLEFENPEAAKQKKLKDRGVIRWAQQLSPMVRLYRRSRIADDYDLVPMGAAWSRDRVETFADRLLPELPWLMDHQRRALSATLSWRSGVIVAPCGAGKTQMGIGLHHFGRGLTLVLVHTRDLAQQWADRFASVLGGKARVCLGSAHLAEGLERQKCGTLARLWVSTFQTMSAAIADRVELPAWGTVIVDEAHHAPAKTFQEVLAGIHCERVYGLTATPNRDDGWTPAMYAWLGPCRYKVESAHLQRIGLTVAPLVVEVRTGAYSASGDFTTIMEHLCGDEARNALVARTVAEHGDFPQLVLTSRVDHAERLAKLIPESLVMVGKTRKRDEVLEAVRSGAVKVLIATQLADEGLDLPTLTAVHMTTPSRAAGRVIQRAGRVMRSAPGKARPTVYDYVDDMGLLVNQWRARKGAYARELAGVEFKTKAVTRG